VFARTTSVVMKCAKSYAVSAAIVDVSTSKCARAVAVVNTFLCKLNNIAVAGVGIHVEPFCDSNNEPIYGSALILLLSIKFLSSFLAQYKKYELELETNTTECSPGCKKIGASNTNSVYFDESSKSGFKFGATVFTLSGV
jgi:hypothetical protein